MKTGDSLYFIGIGGARLSALAKIYQEKGYQVSGSDLRPNKTTAFLEDRGILVDYGHDPGKIDQRLDLVIYTNAVGKDNPQLAAAVEQGIPVLEGAELLGLLMKEKKCGIAVAGTHGKTTTTAMLSLLLLKGGMDPTIVIGGEMKELPGNHRNGNSPYMVVEACEFRRSFLRLSPKIAIVTNVDWDHPDCFPNSEEVVETFKRFIALLPSDGELILWRDDAHFEELALTAKTQVTSFGFTPEADWSLRNMEPLPSLGIRADVFHKNCLQGQMVLQTPGRHNLLNALASLAAATSLGLKVSDSLATLKGFSGVKRRFEIKGKVHDILVVDDYAHHPAAVSATLQTARHHFPGRIWCVFQPHLFSRTRYLLNGFAQAFSEADILLLADIYAARERDTGDISSRVLAEQAGKYHKDVRYIGELSKIGQHLLENARSGDLIITMGAGDIWRVGEEFLAKKRETPKEQPAYSRMVEAPKIAEEEISRIF